MEFIIGSPTSVVEEDGSYDIKKEYNYLILLTEFNEFIVRWDPYAL